MMKKFLFDGESGLSPAANIGLTLLRLFSGLALAFSHGFGKLPPSDGFIDATAKLGFPMPVVFAWAAGLSEFFGGLFLALGLFTRVSSFFVAFTMAVAAFVAHAADPFQKKEMALLYMFIAIAFMFKGSGDWSLDALIRRK